MSTPRPQQTTNNERNKKEEEEDTLVHVAIVGVGVAVIQRNARFDISARSARLCRWCLPAGGYNLLLDFQSFLYLVHTLLLLAAEQDSRV